MWTLCWTNATGNDYVERHEDETALKERLKYLCIQLRIPEADILVFSPTEGRTAEDIAYLKLDTTLGKSLPPI